MHFDVVIVGGGLASARAIKTYREAGGRGRLALFSSDESLPYHRPPLSKRYLKGEVEPEQTLVETETFYDDHGVAVFLRTPIRRVALDEREVEDEDGHRYGFGELVLAPGATPRRLPVSGGTLDGVFALRSLADATAIRDAARTAKRAVVVGAGFIGMEVGASLRQLGLDVSLVHLGQGLYDQFRAAELSRELAELYGERGVELYLEDAVAGFRGDSTLAAVETESGKILEADLAVVGVGVVPSTHFLADSGLPLDDGIVVDERFESVPGVYAVGDAARFYDPLYGRHRRIEHWSNANYQGSELGKILAGAEGGYETLSSFFTEVFGVTIKLFGDSTAGGDVVMRGSLHERDLVGFYLDEDWRLVAAIAAGQEEDVEDALRELVRGRRLARERAILSDRSTSLEEAFALIPSGAS
ncbi:MAG TPA: FAD-dependent oxidoreductase [Gaiellaceae bacterium]|nr:FAD-dependent oxidoreductase [Gaiellaceae bacterium]